jgi:hypothetical protein
VPSFPKCLHAARMVLLRAGQHKRQYCCPSPLSLLPSFPSFPPPCFSHSTSILGLPLHCCANNSSSWLLCCVLLLGAQDISVGLGPTTAQTQTLLKQKKPKPASPTTKMQYKSKPNKTTQLAQAQLSKPKPKTHIHTVNPSPIHSGLDPFSCKL